MGLPGATGDPSARGSGWVDESPEEGGRDAVVHLVGIEENREDNAYVLWLAS